jgi:hypothetical protein
MNGYKFDDTLELLGLLGGGFVVVVALGTLIGVPWSTARTGGVGLVQTVGVLLTLLVGLGTIAIAYNGDLSGAVSNDEATESE